MKTEDLKEKYKAEFLLIVDGSKGEKKAYLKKPDRIVLSAFVAKISSDPIKANEILLQNLIISEISDEDILKDDEYFINAINSLDELITVKKSTLRKL
jgi:hypothetical protein